MTHKQDHCWLNQPDPLRTRILIHWEEEKLFHTAWWKKQLLTPNRVGGIWMCSAAHSITNTLDYFISLNNLWVCCCRLALELPSSLKQDAFPFPVRARLELPGWAREEAPGEHHRLCVTGVRASSSPSIPERGTVGTPPWASWQSVLHREQRARSITWVTFI